MNGEQQVLITDEVSKKKITAYIFRYRRLSFESNGRIRWKYTFLCSVHRIFIPPFKTKQKKDGRVFKKAFG